MLARIQSSAIFGIDGIPLSVEVDNYPGLNKLTIVGLPDAAVKESEKRVNSAIKNSGFRTPRGITVVNLAPADLRVELVVGHAKDGDLEGVVCVPLAPLSAQSSDGTVSFEATHRVDRAGRYAHGLRIRARHEGDAGGTLKDLVFWVPT